jgi:hypothetical protein
MRTPEGLSLNPILLLLEYRFYVHGFIVASTSALLFRGESCVAGPIRFKACEERGTNAWMSNGA